MTTFGRDGRIAGVVGLAALSAFALVALLVGFPAAATTAGTGSMGMMGGTAGPGIGAFLFMLLPLVTALALGYAGVQALIGGEAAETDGPRASRNATDEDPLQRLQQRYTEGELTEDEFERALERELSDETRETENGLGEVESGQRTRSEPARER